MIYVDDENKFEWIIFKMSPGFNELRDLSGKALYVQISLILTEGNFIESIMDIAIWNLNGIFSWISNHVHVKVWIEITDPFSNLTGLAARRSVKCRNG